MNYQFHLIRVTRNISERARIIISDTCEIGPALQDDIRLGECRVFVDIPPNQGYEAGVFEFDSDGSWERVNPS